MVDNAAREQAIYQSLKAVDEVGAAVQAHLIQEHGADLEHVDGENHATNSLKLLAQARERLSEGLQAVGADHIAESDDISLRKD